MGKSVRNRIFSWANWFATAFYHAKIGSHRAEPPLSVHASVHNRHFRRPRRPNRRHSYRFASILLTAIMITAAPAAVMRVDTSSMNFAPLVSSSSPPRTEAIMEETVVIAVKNA